MNDPSDNTFGEQKIEINNTEKNNNVNSGSENRESRVTNVSSQVQSDLRSNIEQEMAKGITEKAKEQVYKSWFDRYLCCFNWLKPYFKITSKDFITRIIQSLIPFNSTV